MSAAVVLRFMGFEECRQDSLVSADRKGKSPGMDEDGEMFEACQEERQEKSSGQEMGWGAC